MGDAKRCTVDGCEKPVVARGFCQNHYRVFMRRGNATPPKKAAKIHVATGGYLFRTINRKTVYLHIEAAEKAIGKKLPDGAEVHHVNGNPSDNENKNLVICPNHEYHSMLHQRQRALDAFGNADARPCHICGKYDLTENMRPHYKQFYHKSCLAESSKNRRAKKSKLSEGVSHEQ